MKPSVNERILPLINRLSARKRWAWAARIYGGWLDAMRRDVDGVLYPMPLEMWRHGGLLCNAGDYVTAARVFRELATYMARPDSKPVHFLQRSFDEWARCLDACGSHKSAAETRAMGRRLAAKRKRTQDEELGHPHALSPSSLLQPTLSRCSFMLSLEWEMPGETFDPITEGKYLILRERFRFDDPQTAWFEFEAKAPSEPDPSYPHIAVCLTFPWRFVGSDNRLAALSVVNEMNLDNAATSTCLDPSTGQIAVRARLGFTGFHEDCEPYLSLSLAQSEATVNMMLEVLTMAQGWHKQLADLHKTLGHENT